MWFLVNRSQVHRVFSILVALILSTTFLVTLSYDEKYGSIQIEPKRSDHLIVSGWTFPWDNSSWTTMQEWDSGLDEVSPYWYYTLENGTLVDSHDRTEDLDYIILCRSRGIEIIPMISNNHNTSIVSNIINDLSVQEHHIEQLLYMTVSNGFEGVDINYENIPTAQKDGFSLFIQRLASAFHQRSKKVYVSVFPKISDDETREGPGAYDYRSLGEHADSIRVMVYNLHWSSAPMSGPITSFEWVRTVLEYSVEAIPEEKVSLGIPLFGYDWIVDRTGRALSIAENVSFEYISQLLDDPGIDREWNGTSRTPHLQYVESSGKIHAIHYNDAESLLHEMLIARELGISRISLWRIGDEDPLVREYISLMRANGLADLPPYVDIGNDRSGMKGKEISIGPVRAYDLDGKIVDINWDLGDGNNSNLLDPIHMYSSGGSYSATFSTIDDGGNAIERIKCILIGPYPYFEVSGDLQVGGPVHFDASGSWDLGTIVSYNWYLGDGTYQFHAGPVIEHIFNRPGKFGVQLSVINDKGYTDYIVIEVDIPDIEPPIVIAGPDISIWEDMTFIFDGRSSHDNSAILYLEWYFPDGTVIDGSTAEHSFSDPGTYEVVLVGTDPSGLTTNDTMMVEVKDRTSPRINVSFSPSISLGSSVFINATSSEDNVGIDNVTWKLPNGAFLYEEMTLLFIPSYAGRYHFTLDIMDRRGNWNSTSFHIDVLDVEIPYIETLIDPAPAVYNETYIHSLLNGSDTYGVNEADHIFVVNVTYRFLITEMEDESGIGYINWSFGDGTHAFGGSVYHNYSLPGRYIITLIVDDIHGNRYREDMDIVVLPTVNFTLLPVQPYQNVYVNQTVEEKEDERRIIPIVSGIIAIIVSLIVFLVLLFSEIITTIRYLRKHDEGGGPS